jgi:hypothetical protein
MPHVPALHTTAAFSGVGHTFVQEPQKFGSFCRSWQVPLQQVSAEFRHGCVAEQPCAHAFCTQISPPGQSVSSKHATHVLVAVSQFGVAPLQSVLSLQPAAHALLVVQN